MEISGQDSLLPKIDFEKPRKITTSEMRKFYIDICAGKWTLAVKGQPDWASRAFSEFCRSCRAGLRNKSIGYAALKPTFSQPAKSLVESNLDQVGDVEDNVYESDAIEFRKPASLAELAVILARGKLIPLDVPVPDNDREFFISHTARAYLFFFIAWREISALKTKKVSAIHKWLIRMKAIPTDTPYKDTSRNTRALLNRIGFPLADKGGRPKKKNPTTAPMPRPV